VEGAEALVEGVAGGAAAGGAAPIGRGEAGRGIVLLAVVGDSVRAEEFLQFPVFVRDGNFFLNGAGVGFLELHHLLLESFDIDFFALTVGSMEYGSAGQYDVHGKVESPLSLSVELLSPGESWFAIRFRTSSLWCLAI